MLKLAGLWSAASTGLYNAGKGVGKALLTKPDAVTGKTRLGFKKMAVTAGGLYAGHKVLGEMKKQQSNLSRDYMGDVHPYRQSDTLRVAR